MKKIAYILLVCVMAFAALFAVGCKDKKDSVTPPPGDTTQDDPTPDDPTPDDPTPDDPTPDDPTPKTVYEVLNELAKKLPAGVRLTVTTVVDGNTLTGTYEYAAQTDGYTVTYSYEKLNAIEVSDDGIVVPSESKSTVSGESTAATAMPNIEFAESYFTDFTDTQGSVTATVTNIGAFMKDADFEGENMGITLSYTSQAITSLTVTYTTATAQVTRVYAFTY